MSERTRKILIFATLPLAVVWALFNLPSNEEQPAVRPPAVQLTVETPAIAPVPPGAGLINVEDKAAQPWGADPFRTSGLYQSGAPGIAPLPREWRLKGIVYTEDNPLAFINRQSVRVGDVVNEAEVIAIHKKTVIIKYDGQEITLAVNKG